MNNAASNIQATWAAYIQPTTTLTLQQATALIPEFKDWNVVRELTPAQTLALLKKVADEHPLNAPT